MRDSLARIGALAKRIITQFRRDPRTIALIFIAPLLVLTLVGYVITEKSTTVTVGVVNLDPGASVQFGPASVALNAGGLFEQALDDQSFSFERYSDVESMLSRIEDGKLKGGIVIPAAFTTNVLTGRAFEGLRLIVEGADPTLAGDFSRRYALALQALPEKLRAEEQRLAPPGVTLPPAPAVAKPPAAEFVYGGPDLGTLTYFAPGFVAFFAFFFTFLLTSVSFLRERSSGTMERLLASPVKRGEIVVGYLLGFGLFALLQSLIILLFSVYVLGAHLAGSLISAFVVETAFVAVAVVMGIFFSFYARNELQVIQFIPIVIIPQIVISGFMTPLETLWEPLRWLAMAMPLTYANDALRAVMIRGWGLGSVLGDLAAICGFILFFALLAARMIKRQVA